tara:strand:+ start:1592 stop:2524 length:933 start_codon:yes stop_codon:yes gene_type:complete
MIDRKEWLKWRKKGLGSSDVMQILLRPEWRPYGGPWKVWLSKQEGVDGEDEPTTAMAVGNWLERPIGEWAADQLGMNLEDAGPLVGPEDWIRSTPDFWLVGDGRREGLECKVSRKGKQWKDALPPYVWLQCVWCMICAPEVEVWNAASFLPMSFTQGLYTVERNKEAEEMVLEKAREWWQKHIINGDPPEVDASTDCTSGLVKMYPHIKHEMREASVEEDARLTELWRLNQEAKKITEDKKRLLNQICSEIGDSKGIKGSDCYVNWSETKGATRLDSKALKAAHPEVWDEFAVTGKPSRSARLYAAKEKK